MRASLGFVSTPSTYSWSGTNSTVITVKNNGSTTIPSGTTIYVENRMRTLVAGRTLAAVQTPPIVGSKVTLIPGSCVAFSYLSGSYASYGCRMTLNSNFLPNETFDAQFTFTLSSAGSPLIPGGPNNQLNNCGTGWLTTPRPWLRAFSGVTIQLPGWTFLNAYGGHGEVGCGVGAPPARDVSIRKLGGGNVPAGSSVNFTLNAQNNGPGTVNSVTVSDTLAAGLTSVVITAGLNWNCAQSAPNVTPQSFTCTYVGPPVGPGAAFLGPIGIQAIAQTAGSFQNCASIALVGGIDTNLANNTFCQPYVVTAAPPAKDVTIRKAAFRGRRSRDPRSASLLSGSSQGLTLQLLLHARTE